MLGCHSDRNHRADMVGSSSSSPWRFLTVFLLREILAVLAFYFNLKNGKIFKIELSFPVDVAKNKVLTDWAGISKN